MKRERCARILELKTRQIREAAQQRGQPLFLKSRFRTRWYFPHPVVLPLRLHFYWGEAAMTTVRKICKKTAATSFSVNQWSHRRHCKIDNVDDTLFQLAALSTHKHAVAVSTQAAFYIARLKLNPIPRESLTLTSHREKTTLTCIFIVSVDK